MIQFIDEIEGCPCEDCEAFRLRNIELKEYVAKLKECKERLTRRFAANENGGGI